MTIQIYVLLGSGRLEGLADDVRSSVRRTCRLVEPTLPLADVDIVVRDDRYRFIPEWGVGGFTPDAHTVQVNVDAARIDGVMLNERLPSPALTVRSGPGSGRLGSTLRLLGVVGVGGRNA